MMTSRPATLLILLAALLLIPAVAAHGIGGGNTSLDENNPEPPSERVILGGIGLLTGLLILIGYWSYRETTEE